MSLIDHVVQLAPIYYSPAFKNAMPRVRRIQTIGAIIRKTTGVKRASDDPLVVAVEQGCVDHTNEWATLAGVPHMWADDRYVSKYDITVARVQKYIVSGALSRGIEPRALASTPAEIIWPDKYAADYAGIEAQRAARVEEKCSNVYGDCKICGKAWATCIKAQTAGLDEGETLFIACRAVGCTNTWRFRA